MGGRTKEGEDEVGVGKANIKIRGEVRWRIERGRDRRQQWRRERAAEQVAQPL